MTDEEILSKMLPVISEALEVNIDKLTPDINLTDKFKADTLDKLAIVMGIEDEFNIWLDVSDVDCINTVQDLITDIKKHMT